MAKENSRMHAAIARTVYTVSICRVLYHNRWQRPPARNLKSPLAHQTALWYNLPRFVFGGIAQLVERLNGIEKVRGSTPLTSTTPNVRVEQWLPCSSTARFRSAATNAKAVPSTPCFARLNAALASRSHCTKTYLPHPKQRRSTGARSKQLSVSRIVRNVV